MENLQPAAVEGDDKAIESLTLHRPEGKSGCLLILIFALLNSYIVWVLDGVEELSVKRLRWPQKDAEEFTLLLGAACMTGIFFVALLIRRHSPPIKLHIEKGSEKFASEEEHFEIWDGINSFTRAMGPLFLFLLGIWLIRVGVLGNLWSEQFYGLCGLCLCVFVLFNQIRPIFHPLLVANEKGVGLLGNFSSWDQVQRVEVEHATNFDGGFSAVRVTVVGTDGRKIGRVSLAKEKLSAVEEKELLEFFARRLGRRVLPVAQDSPDWI